MVEAGADSIALGEAVDTCIAVVAPQSTALPVEADSTVREVVQPEPLQLEAGRHIAAPEVDSNTPAVEEATGPSWAA